jgi:hypothetical protein
LAFMFFLRGRADRGPFSLGLALAMPAFTI